MRNIAKPPSCPPRQTPLGAVVTTQVVETDSSVYVLSVRCANCQSIFLVAIPMGTSYNQHLARGLVECLYCGQTSKDIPGTAWEDRSKKFINLGVPKDDALDHVDDGLPKKRKRAKRGKP